MSRMRQRAQDKTGIQPGPYHGNLDTNQEPFGMCAGLGAGRSPGDDKHCRSTGTSSRNRLSISRHGTAARRSGNWSHRAGELVFRIGASHSRAFVAGVAIISPVGRQFADSDGIAHSAQQRQDNAPACARSRPADEAARLVMARHRITLARSASEGPVSRFGFYSLLASASG